MNLRPFTRFELTIGQKAALADRLLAKAKPTVDYDLIAKTYDTLEERYVASLTGAIEKARDEVLKHIETEFKSDETTMDWVTKLRLRMWNPVRSELREMAGASFTTGRATFRREVTGSTELAVSVTPRDAVQFMDERMFWVSGVMKDTLTRKSQTILAQAIKNGEPLRATMRKLRELFAPYVGDTVDGKVVTPARLETVVRTNITEAYNQGRLTELHHPDIKGLVEGVRYSAILDSRTTEVCNFLHDKVFREDLTGVDRLAPPNHFNCRSVLVPVVIGEEVEEYAGEAELNRAMSITKAGFGGDVAELTAEENVDGH